MPRGRSKVERSGFNAQKKRKARRTESELANVKRKEKEVDSFLKRNSDRLAPAVTGAKLKKAKGNVKKQRKAFVESVKLRSHLQQSQQKTIEKYRRLKKKSNSEGKSFITETNKKFKSILKRANGVIEEAKTDLRKAKNKLKDIEANIEQYNRKQKELMELRRERKRLTEKLEMAERY